MRIHDRPTHERNALIWLAKQAADITRRTFRRELLWLLLWILLILCIMLVTIR